MAKNIAPQYIEGVLCLETLIHQAMVYGDDHKYLVALIVVTEILEPDLLHKLLDEALKRSNKLLLPHERIKNYSVIHEAFTTQNAMLTPSLKLRRHQIIAHYGQELEKLYAL